MRTIRTLPVVFVAGAISPLLLLCGLLLDGFTRSGYEPVRHGVSQLTLGDRGWAASLLFVACGALLIAAVLIAFRLPVPEPKWQWRLLAMVGAGLVIAGVFPTDPALGYPPGVQEQISAAGVIHQVGGTMLFAGMTAAAVVAGRAARRRGQRRWSVVCVAVAWAVAGLACAAGVVFRLVQRDVVDSGPAGLLESLSMGCGLCWVSVAMLRDAPSGAYAQRR